MWVNQKNLLTYGGVVKKPILDVRTPFWRPRYFSANLRGKHDVGGLPWPDELAVERMHQVEMEQEKGGWKLHNSSYPAWPTKLCAWLKASQEKVGTRGGVVRAVGTWLKKVTINVFFLPAAEPTGHRTVRVVVVVVVVVVGGLLWGHDLKGRPKVKVNSRSTKPFCSLPLISHP